MLTIDARGHSCPEPVLLTKKALASHPDQCTVLLDNIVAVENVTRFAGYSHYRVERSGENGEFQLLLTRE
ncbi:MAG: sulfurtransferase TusA family protein [Eubacteriales bacterium]